MLRELSSDKFFSEASIRDYLLTDTAAENVKLSRERERERGVVQSKNDYFRCKPLWEVVVVAAEVEAAVAAAARSPAR